MTIEAYQRSLNTVDKNIADFEKKRAGINKKIADIDAKIASDNRSISNTRSVSTFNSKVRHIQTLEKERTRKISELANLQKKLAAEMEKRAKIFANLQKLQHKNSIEQTKILKNLEDLQKNMTTEVRNNLLHEVRVAKKENEFKEYDVFISHAWEDKESFVEEFVLELKKLNIKVWYDKSAIKWGDSMRAKIDEGLKNSKFGIVVISPNYIAEGKYWTKAELDGLFQMESVNGKVLLPIWHNITKQEVLNYSPIIANKKALSTGNMTIDEIAKEVFEILKSDEEVNNEQTKI